MNYAVFDIEAENWIRLKVIGFYDGETFSTFDNADDFLKHIDRKRYNGWRLYAHYGGKYDFLFLLKWLFATCDMRFLERQGRIIAIMVKTRRGNSFTFADSYCLLPQSLERLTTAFDVQHKKKLFTFTEGAKLKVTKRLVKYLEHDCKGLYEVLQLFFDQDFIGKPQLTIASQAMDTFRRKFLDCELYQTDLKVENDFRENFYSGGRVEVFKGRGKVNVYDVNSLFPSVMVREMPCGVPKKTMVFVQDRIGFYKVKIRSTPEFYIPPYLLKVAENSYSRKNFFVNGNGEYFFSSDFLLYLRKEYGVRFDVLYGYVFPQRREFLKDYVETMYKMKLENKGNAKGEIAKLLLNSLYGRFAMRRFQESLETYRGQKEWALPDNAMMHEFGLVLVETESKSEYILPYVAAYITDLARLEHWKLMQLHPHDMFYCDTDSLFTTAEYEHGDQIGQLSFKGRYDGVFLGAKSYALKNASEERVIFKGFNPKKFSFSDFEAAQAGELMLESEETAVLSFRESFTARRERIVETKGQFLNLVTKRKKVITLYDKRKMHRSKRWRFDTEAFTFKEKMQ